MLLRYFVVQKLLAVALTVMQVPLMFPQPFQYFRMVEFAPTEFFMCWAIGGMILGVPVLLVIFGLGRLRFFRLVRWQTVAWLLPLLGLMFGLASGLLVAWDDHEYYAARQPANSDHWYDVLGGPARRWPGRIGAIGVRTKCGISEATSPS